jgi:hypothetical protein
VGSLALVGSSNSSEKLRNSDAVAGRGRAFWSASTHLCTHQRLPPRFMEELILLDPIPMTPKPAPLRTV